MTRTEASMNTLRQAGDELADATVADAPQLIRRLWQAADLANAQGDNARAVELATIAIQDRAALEPLRRDLQVRGPLGREHQRGVPVELPLIVEVVQLPRLDPVPFAQHFLRLPDRLHEEQ